MTEDRPAPAPVVRVRLTADIQPYGSTAEWPAGWPVPRVGDPVTIARLAADNGPLQVRDVDWYLEGTEEDPTPFVYVVIGRYRAEVRGG